MVEQATENRCVGGSIPPLGTTFMKKKYFIIYSFLLIIFSCDFDKKEYFPSTSGIKWMYSVIIDSSYTGKSYKKRVMVTNTNQKKKGSITEISRLYSDGSYYTYEIDKKKITRTSVILAFDEGIVEPVKKIIYPDVSFNQKEWNVKEQLFLVKGFQPPLRNVIPRSQFDMNYKITRLYRKFKLNGNLYKDCIEISGSGSTDFIGDTRSGPINVDIKNIEILCNGIGLVKQVRTENTNASAFGNMTLIKDLMSFN